MSQPLTAALRHLLEQHPEPVPASIFTAAQRKALDAFGEKARCIQRTRKGRGVVYSIVIVEVVQLKLQKLSPGNTLLNTNLPKNAQSLPTVPQRAANIAHTRSSKSGHSATHDLTHILMKTVGQPSWYCQKRQTTHLDTAMIAFGVVGIEIGGEKNQQLCSDCPIWLVENQALFDTLDWLPSTQPSTVIWYRGQLHNKLIEWLSCPDRAPVIYFFADYDGVGLNNYLRLKVALTERAEFWFMPNWRELLSKYGQNELWISTSNAFKAFERHGNGCSE